MQKELSASLRNNTNATSDYKMSILPHFVVQSIDTISDHWNQLDNITTEALDVHYNLWYSRDTSSQVSCGSVFRMRACRDLRPSYDTPQSRLIGSRPDRPGSHIPNDSTSYTVGAEQNIMQQGHRCRTAISSFVLHILYPTVYLHTYLPTYLPKTSRTKRSRLYFYFS